VTGLYAFALRKLVPKNAPSVAAKTTKSAITELNFSLNDFISNSRTRLGGALNFKDFLYFYTFPFYILRACGAHMRFTACTELFYYNKNALSINFERGLPKNDRKRGKNSLL